MKKINMALIVLGICACSLSYAKQTYAAENDANTISVEENTGEQTESIVSEGEIPSDFAVEEEDAGLVSPIVNQENTNDQIETILNGWQEIDGQKYYYIDNEKIVGESFIDGKWYYFDEASGAMTIGFKELGDRLVYYLETGEMVFGESNINGSWYYFSEADGDMQTGFQSLGNRLVYYDELGKMQFGECVIDGKEYFFSFVNGSIQTGRQMNQNGEVRYYLPEGGVATGEICEEGNWYYFDDDTAVMYTGYKQLGDRLVYYNENGAMAFGEAKIDGKWYYFSPADGNRKTGFLNLDNRKVYYADTGEMLFGEQIIDHKVYYFQPSNGDQYIGLFTDEDGKIMCYAAEGNYAVGEICLNGNWYYFDEKTFEMVTGFMTLGDRLVYYDVDGKMTFGEKYINGHWYYFNNSNGDRYEGFINLGAKTVYYDSNGWMIFGEQSIGGKEYYFSTSDGAMMVSGWHNDKYYGTDGVLTSTMAGKIEELKTYLWVPYVYGGSSTRGWDCSGFTKWALQFIGGVTIPRTTQQQALAGSYVDKNNMSVWRPGDILCYSTGNSIGHVAIYLGDGMLMHALNSKYGTMIQGVSFYETWDSGTTLVAVRRYL